MYIIFNIIHVFFFLVKNSKKSSLCFSKTRGLTQYFFRKRLKKLFLQKGLDWRICVFEGKSVAATAQGGLCSGLAVFDPVRAEHLPLLPRWQNTHVPSPASGMWLPLFQPHWWSGRAKKLSMPGVRGTQRWNSSLYRSFHLTGMCQGWFGCCTAAMRAIQSVVKGPAGTQGITSLSLPRCHQGSHTDPVSPSALLLGQNTSFTSTVEWKAPLPFPSILGLATHSDNGEGCTLNATHTWRYITVSSFRDYCNNCAVWPMNTAEKNRFLLESDCLISCSKAASASIKHVCNSPSTFSESIWSLNKHSLMLEQAWCLKK